MGLHRASAWTRTGFLYMYLNPALEKGRSGETSTYSFRIVKLRTRGFAAVNACVGVWKENGGGTVSLRRHQSRFGRPQRPRPRLRALSPPPLLPQFHRFPQPMHFRAQPLGRETLCTDAALLGR